MNETNPQRIYIASPYSIGDKGENVMRSMGIADKLLDMGLFPYCPLLNHFQNSFYPRDERDWLALDMAWLGQCEMVLRLPGKSSGADAEISEAVRLKIPVAYGLEDLISKLLTGKNDV